jgi:hypothetical protein
MTTSRKQPTRLKSTDIAKGTKTAKTSALRPDEMSADVVEFITAMDEYKRRQRRPFPNWSEVLEVVKKLGYTRKSA